jgi:hypothetical protein
MVITKSWGVIAKSPAHPCLASAITFMHASVGFPNHAPGLSWGGHQGISMYASPYDGPRLNAPSVLGRQNLKDLRGTV